MKKTIIFSQTIEEAAEEGESEVFDEVNISHDFFSLYFRTFVILTTKSYEFFTF